MVTSTQQTDHLLECLSALSEIPLQYTERGPALKRITELGRKALGSHVCALTCINLDRGTLEFAAFAGPEEELEKTLLGKEYHIGPANKRSLHEDVILRHTGDEPRAFYNLWDNGQGVARPEVARRFGLCSLLAIPLRSGGRILGFLNHFTETAEPFTAHDETLLKIFARHAVITIDGLERHQTIERSLSIRNRLTQDLLRVTPEDFLKRVCQGVCELLKVSICMLWRLDEQKNFLRVVAASDDVDNEWRTLEIPPSWSLGQVSDRRVHYLENVTQEHPRYIHREKAAEREWVSLLTVPMWVGERPIGMLDVYSRRYRRSFSKWEKESFAALANYAALFIQKTEELSRQERLKRLNEGIRKLAEARDPQSLGELILQCSLELVGCDNKRGSISRLDFKTGKLHIVSDTGELRERGPLDLDEGITGRTLQSSRAIREGNVLTGKYKDDYKPFWPDTLSELAVPIVLEQAEVRVLSDVQRASKRLGVLNVESPIPNAFTQDDEDLLVLLAQHAASRVEKFESERKKADVERVERQLLGKQDWDETVEIVLPAIRDLLGCDFVNLSLVDLDQKVIKTERVIGMDRDRENEFKRMACHDLGGGDIQAYVYRSREDVVPAFNDKRLDPEIVRTFNQHNLIRVYIPMTVPASGRVIGTVEASYERTFFREYIYEEDVKILKGFVEYVTLALEQRERGLLDRVSHSFYQTVVGVRNNASFLHRRFDQLLAEDKPKILRKLEDVLTDCESLFHLVGKLEYILGRAPEEDEGPTRTVVMRDVVVKTINQLKPLAEERGFDPKRMHYENKDVGKVVLFVERSKLNEVAYNLLTNAIKYAEDDPKKFGIRVDVEETRDHFVLKFKDWGIGIAKGLEEKIFDNGFRGPAAYERHVSGTGLGLTIARKAARDIGGDLKLSRPQKPTTFDVVLPKSLKEEPR